MHKQIFLACLVLSTTPAFGQLTSTGTQIQPLRIGPLGVSGGFTSTMTLANGLGRTRVENALVNLQVPRTYSGNAMYRVGNYHFFSTSNIPVKVHTVTWSANYKLVVGGGGQTNPSAFSAMSVAFYEFEDDNNDGILNSNENFYGPVLPHDADLAQVNGNGLQIVNKAGGTDSSYILAANRKYMFFVGHEIRISQNALSSSEPTSVITWEGTPAFDGIEATFSYEAVPEPASMAALAVGTLFALKRRRR